METRSNLLMTLVRCLILRSPSGKASVTILQAVELCFGHFIVTQLLITPLVLIAVLNVSNIAELRAMCNFNEWMEGACLNIRHRRLSNIILVAAMVMNSIFFLTTLLEYFTRHGLDVAEESGKCPTPYRAAMTIRGSLPYRTFLTTSLLFSLFFFCAYFITVTSRHCALLYTYIYIYIICWFEKNSAFDRMVAVLFCFETFCFLSNCLLRVSRSLDLASCRSQLLWLLGL